ncbi:MAG: inorganic diphosphatase [Alphaproteobacteria bacterium]|nr:inorganic diphosphatase [Alphaproteobacteria bacterium]
MNLLHDISPGTKDEMQVIIEIPRGSKNKYEIDKKTGVIALDRVLHTSQDYPFDYGFIPQTLWDDGDALDVVLITTYPLFPGVLVRVRPIALIDMLDSGESDVKIVGVPVDDPRFAEFNDLEDVSKHFIKEVTHFFETMKLLQKKVVTIEGVYGKAKAIEAFERAINLYQQSKKQ